MVASTATYTMDVTGDNMWSSADLYYVTDITKGIMIGADFGFPKDCSGDVVCITLKGLLNGARLRCSIVLSTAGIQLSAMLVDLKITDDLTLTKVGLEVSLGTKNQMGILGEIKVKVGNGQYLKFGSEVAVVFDPPKVIFKGYMVGNPDFAMSIATLTFGCPGGPVGQRFCHPPVRGR